MSSYLSKINQKQKEMKHYGWSEMYEMQNEQTNEKWKRSNHEEWYESNVWPLHEMQHKNVQDHRKEIISFLLFFLFFFFTGVFFLITTITSQTHNVTTPLWDWEAFLSTALLNLHKDLYTLYFFLFYEILEVFDYRNYRNHGRSD